ncbi:hypothetical protein ACFLTB_06520 [Chloroflexota bacterium]
MEKPDINDLLSEKPGIKYPCARQLIALSKEYPAELNPHLGFFVELLDSENKIIRWTAIDIIGALARVDDAGAIDNLLDRIIGLLSTGNMITANHAVSALTDIALAKQEYGQRITGELLKVEHYDYDTDECRNIVIGKVILALGKFSDKLEDNKAMLGFVSRQTNNTRNATARKAEQLLRKINRKTNKTLVS